MTGEVYGVKYYLGNKDLIPENVKGNVDENVFYGEILGQKFSADFSPALEFLPKLRFLRFLVPPVIRLGVLIVSEVI